MSWVLNGGGAVVRKLRTAMSIKARLGPLALITFFELWKCLEMGLNPRIMCIA